MNEYMPYGETVQELTHLRAKYEQFIIDRERERINGIIDQFIENSDYPEVVSSLEWLQDVIKGEY
jgi:hypothetical protein